MKIAAGVWKHYKGGYYLVIGLAAHTETNEEMVVYVSLTGAHLPGLRMRVRPASMFLGVVQVDSLIPGTVKHVPRFEYVGLEIRQ